MPSNTDAAQRVTLSLLGVLATFLLLLIVAAQAHAATIANFNRVTYSYTSTWPTAQEAGTYQVMVMQSTNAATVAKLKAANPNLKVFMYMDALTSNTADTGAQTVCTSYTSDNTSSPSWFLTDQNGNRILQSGTTTKYVMDVGNPAYQQACVSHAIALAQQNGFDGIFWDDVETDFRWVFPSGTTSPEYPTATSYYNSFLSFVQYAGAQIHAAGLLTIGNLCAATPAQWAALNTPLDGAEEESFTDGGVGTSQQIPYTTNKLTNVQWSEANGKYVLLHSYNGTETGNTYGIASMMLVAGGHTSYATSNTCYTNCETWYPEYTTAQQLGQPVGTYMKLPNGAFIRWYSNGLVLANVTTNTLPSFSLGGGTYTGSGLTSVPAVSMGSATGYVLLADPGNVVSAPADTTAPSISGSVWKGQTLTANPGSWSGSPTPTYQYQWSRCTSAATTSCYPISGATGATYVVQSADIDQYLEVAVTGVNSGGIASATSAETSQVPIPTFTLTASPTSQTKLYGNTFYYTITVNPIDGWTGPVALSAGGAPAGGSISLSKASTSTSATLRVATSRASIGTWTVTVSGSATGQTTGVSVTVNVT